MGFSRQEYWSGFPFLSPEDLTDSGVKPGSPAFQANSLPSEAPGITLSRVQLFATLWTVALGIFPMQSHLALKLQDLLWLLYKTLSKPFKPYFESQPALQMASALTSLRGQPTTVPFNVKFSLW